MSTPIQITPNDGDGSGTYPPASSPTPAASPTPSPTPTPTPTPTPSPAPTPLPASSARASSLVTAIVSAVDAFIIPLAAAPAQEFAVALGQQGCRIRLYTRGDRLYLDLLVSDVTIVQGVACLDRVPMVRAAYTGFVGELVFLDTQGASDPAWSGLGTRYLLAWLGA